MKMGVKIKKSGIAGKGVVAERAYSKGELIIQPKGRILHSRKINWKSKEKYGMNYLQVSPWKYLEPVDPLLRYINHSCNPDMGYKSIKGKPSFIAIKKIKKGQELDFDYSTTMLEEWDEDISSLRKCTCGSKNCREYIRDFRNLPKKTQKRYISLGVVPDYILKHMKRKK